MSEIKLAKLISSAKPKFFEFWYEVINNEGINTINKQPSSKLFNSPMSAKLSLDIIPFLYEYKSRDA
mgnify:CR=1 FL=1